MLSMLLSNNSTQAAVVSSTVSVRAALITKSGVCDANGSGESQNRDEKGG